MSKKFNINRMRGSEPKKRVNIGGLSFPEVRMNTPCTVAECAQISLAAAKDMLDTYMKSINKLVLEQTLFLDSLKRILVAKNLMTEDEFSKMVSSVSDEFNKNREEYLKSIRESNMSVETTENPTEGEESEPDQVTDTDSTSNTEEVSNNETESN